MKDTMEVNSNALKKTDFQRLVINIESYSYELLAKEIPFSVMLEKILVKIEKFLPSTKCSILLLDKDGRHLRHGAAPSLPKSYNDLIDGLEIGPEVGSCGTAAYLNKQVIVSNTVTDYRWKAFRDQAKFYKLYSCYSTPITSSKGEVLGTFANYKHTAGKPEDYELQLINDLTIIIGNLIERKRITSQYELSEKRYRDIFNSANDGIFIIDQKTLSIIEANQQAMKLTGYSADEITGLNVNNLHAHQSERIKSFFAEILEKGNNKTDDLTCLTKNGTYISVEASGSLINLNDKQCFMVIIRDLSERKQAQHQLIIHAAALETAHEGIALLTSKGKHIFANQAYANIFGISDPTVLVGKDWQSLYTDLQIKQFDHENVIKKFKAKGHWQEEVLGLRKNGKELSIDISVTQLASGEIISLCRDITVQKQRERALQQSEDRLRRYYDAGLVGMAIISPEKKWIDFNNTLCDITGYSRDELKKLSWTDITHPDDIEREVGLFNQVLAGQANNYSLDKRYIHKDGSILNVSAAVECVRTHEKNIDYFVMVIQDISDRHEKEELSKQLSHQAIHDALTGLVNRYEFERRLKQLISSDMPNTKHALCYLDLDQFKVINDTCGHEAGDELLRQLSNKMISKVRKQDMLARLGGDEFGVLMENCSVEQAERVANDLRYLINDHEFVWEDKPYQLGVSIGLVPICDKNITVTDVLSAADAACYTAKDAGRNRIHVYDVEDEEVQKRHGEMQWISRIKKALQQDQFCLYYQPIVALKEKSKILGKLFEVLIRMQGDDGAIISPALFLPAAERYNLSTKIDRWVVEKTLKWLASQNEKDLKLTKVSINLSGNSLSDSEFLEFLLDKIAAANIDPGIICFEITETATIANLSFATHFINTLRGIGCQFALDDFGSGLSSLNYLKNLPVDYLKIDGAFVRDIVENPIDHAMVESINQIGQVMGKKTIAEFVENKEILEKLKVIGVDYVQGYHVGKPEPMYKNAANY